MTPSGARAIIINGPGGRTHERLPPVVLFKNFAGDFGASLARTVEATVDARSTRKDYIPLATKVMELKGKGAMMAACTSGVARVGANAAENHYREIYNSRPMLDPWNPAKPHTDTEATLKAKVFDAPMNALTDACRRDVFALADVRKMREGYANPHVLVHAFADNGQFKVHLDQNSRGVALWSLGRTARFCVDISGNCQRHHTIGKDTCPTCHEFKFESGDVLVFDGHIDAQCCHGVLEITDDIVPGAAEALPDWMAERRLSVQWRGRGREDESQGGLGERAEKEGAAYRAGKR